MSVRMTDVPDRRWKRDSQMSVMYGWMDDTGAAAQQRSAARQYGKRRQRAAAAGGRSPAWGLDVRRMDETVRRYKSMSGCRCTIQPATAQQQIRRTAAQIATAYGGGCQCATVTDRGNPAAGAACKYSNANQPIQQIRPDDESVRMDARQYG